MNRRPFLKSLLAVLGAPLVGWRKKEPAPVEYFYAVDLASKDKSYWVQQTWACRGDRMELIESREYPGDLPYHVLEFYDVAAEGV